MQGLVYSLALWIATFLNKEAHKFKMGDKIICKSFHFPYKGPKALFSRKKCNHLFFYGMARPLFSAASTEKDVCIEITIH